LSKVFNPRPYQEATIDFLWKTRRCAAHLGVGLGKTVCAASVIRRSLYEFDTLKWVWVAPKRVCETTLKTEFEKWRHLQHLRVCNVVGADARKRWKLVSATASYDVLVINVALLPWLIARWNAQWPYDGVVIDESSLFKDSSTKRFKSLRRVLPRTDRLIELTGSPCAQSLMGLWSQMYLLDQGAALGRSFTKFRQTHYTSDYMCYKWTLREGAEEAILSAIRPMVMSLQTHDFKGVITPIQNTIPVVLPDEAARSYRELEKQQILKLSKGDKVTAMNAAVLVGKLQQISNGAIYYQDTADVRQSEWVHDAKLDALEEFIAESAGEPFLLAYQFQADRERLLKRFGGDGTVELFDGTARQLERFRQGYIPVLAMQPQSGGHGVDGLQHGTCTVVWMAPPWSREMYDQLNGRVVGARQSDTRFESQPGRIHHLVAKGTIDELIAATLEERGATQDRVMQALKRHVDNVAAETA